MNLWSYNLYTKIKANKFGNTGESVFNPHLLRAEFGSYPEGVFTPFLQKSILLGRVILEYRAYHVKVPPPHENSRVAYTGRRGEFN